MLMLLQVLLAFKCLKTETKNYVFHSLLSLQYSPVTVVGVAVVVVVVTSCEMSLSKSLLELLCY